MQLPCGSDRASSHGLRPTCRDEGLANVLLPWLSVREPDPAPSPLEQRVQTVPLCLRAMTMLPTRHYTGSPCQWHVLGRLREQGVAGTSESPLRPVPYVDLRMHKDAIIFRDPRVCISRYVLLSGGHTGVHFTSLTLGEAEQNTYKVSSGPGAGHSILGRAAPS